MERGLRARVFHRLCRSDAAMPEGYGDAHFLAGLGSTDRFFARLSDDLVLEGRSVIDYGCGDGAGAIWAARRGASRVLGVDVADVTFAREKAREHFPELADRVEFRQIADARDLDGERFDVVLSKNTFEHVGDPADYVASMRALVADDGDVVIGFSPLWKSPWGGHIDFMTRFPWAHLLFPEHVIMAERRRFRPDEDARRFEEIKGGLNRMTLGRFEAVMAASGLEPHHFDVNAAAKTRSRVRWALLRAMRALARIPGLREYFAFSVHGVWRLPDAVAAPLEP
jgi:SAM-dependent methyltransferase